MQRLLRALVAAACGLDLVLAGLTGSASATSSASAAASTTTRDDSKVCRQWMALTFDDGPSYYRTQTLRTLRAKRVPATFFDVGMRVHANPQFAGFEAH